MPGNLVVINGSEGLTWYVGDSKMEKLIKFLYKIGIHEQPEAQQGGEAGEEELACPNCGHIVSCLAPLCDFKSKVTV